VQLGVATLHESNRRRSLLQGIHLLVGEPFAGRAVTVELPAGDNLGVHLAIEQAGPGAVVGVASRGRGLYGVVGELLAEAGRARELAGLVIDDGIRDLGQLTAPPAIAARGTAARGTVKQRLRRAVGTEVSLGGVLVATGDWLVCDADGVCSLSADDLEAVVARAEERVVREGAARERLREGTLSRAVFDLPPSGPASIGPESGPG
jgi:4-hydroxy-4-methyl-2-oxoglutarate aldolase